jgi:hypothetical protein
MNRRIERLKDEIELTYRCRAEHVRSAPVRAISGGKLAWEGIVEVFELVACAHAQCCYAWSYLVNRIPKTCIVLQVPPIDSPEKAVHHAINSGQQIRVPAHS